MSRCWAFWNSPNFRNQFKVKPSDVLGFFSCPVSAGDFFMKLEKHPTGGIYRALSIKRITSKSGSKMKEYHPTITYYSLWKGGNVVNVVVVVGRE